MGDCACCFVVGGFVVCWFDCLEVLLRVFVLDLVAVWVCFGGFRLGGFGFGMLCVFVLCV